MDDVFVSKDFQIILEQLFLTEYHGLYLSAYACFQNKELAEDAVQEAFLKALRYKDKFLGASNKTGWIYLALRYAIKQYYHDKKMIEKRMKKYYEEMSTIFDDPINIELKYANIVDQDDLALLIDIYCNGISFQEAAEQRNISIGACKMRAKRAKEKLKKA